MREEAYQTMLRGLQGKNNRDEVFAKKKLLRAKKSNVGTRVGE